MNMQSRKLIEVRNHLESYLKTLQKAGSLPSSNEVAALFSKAYPQVIADASGDLVILALTKLVAEVGARKSHKPWSDAQNELFDGIPGIPNTIEILMKINGKIQKVKIATPLATHPQLISWLNSQPKKSVSRKSKYVHLNDLQKRLRPFFVKDSTSLEQAMKSFQAKTERLIA